VVPGLGRSEATSAGSGVRRSFGAVSAPDVRLGSETVGIINGSCFPELTSWGYSITWQYRGLQLHGDDDKWVC
tara:strand:- start:122 stop:340 length:219 start_codon:yes stop_codon:yes gene_type:complete